MIQKISEAIKLLISNFTLFSQIVLTIWLPGSILVVFLRLYVFPAMGGGDEFQSFVMELRVSNLIEFACGPIYVGALLYALSNIKQGLTINYRNSMNHGAERSFKLLATRISTGLIIFLGLIAFIIPGIILSLRFALVDMVVVLEGINGSNARKRSTELTKRKRWKIFGAATITILGLLLFDVISSSLLYSPLSIIGQEGNLILNFVVGVIHLGITSISIAVLYIVLFLYYWEAKEHTILAQEEDDYSR